MLPFCSLWEAEIKKSPIYYIYSVLFPNTTPPHKTSLKILVEHKTGSSWQQGKSKMMRWTLGCAAESFRSRRGWARATRQGKTPRVSSLLLLRDVLAPEVLNSAKDGAPLDLTCNKLQLFAEKKKCKNTVALSAVHQCCRAFFESLNCADWLDGFYFSFNGE